MSEPSVTSEVGPWGVVPVWVLRYGLSGAELSVYVALRSFSGARLGTDDPQSVYPRVAKIAERAHVTTRTAERAIAKLRSLGLIVSKRRHDAHGHVKGCDYYLADLDPRPIEGLSDVDNTVDNEKSHNKMSRIETSQNETSQTLTDQMDGALTDEVDGDPPSKWTEQYLTTERDQGEGTISPSGSTPVGARATAQARRLRGVHLEGAEPAELTQRLVAMWTAVVRENGGAEPWQDAPGWGVDGESIPRGRHPIGRTVKAWAESGPHTAAEIDRALDQIRAHARQYATEATA